MSDSGTLNLPERIFHEYLSLLYGSDVKVLGVWRIGEQSAGSKDLKGFGYGFPFVIEFQTGGKTKRVVLETMRPGGFGHDHFSDRAQILLWQHSAFNKLPLHARSVDVGAFENSASLKSLGKCTEFFILMDFVEGKLYHLDLDQIKETGQISQQDEARCLALSNYLVEIHRLKRDEPGLYVRRVRDLVGHGECIMGLLDSYPPDYAQASSAYLVDVEKSCVEWRWRLKAKTSRLSQVHGDFHPWNLLFREGTDFTVLDRSRGEWGEPADDVTALTINYIFYSLQKYGELTGAFERLFTLFWQNYLDKTGDTGILELVQPFYAWRGLVVASPIWYPNLSVDVRTKLFTFIKNVLRTDRFDLTDVNSYFKE